MHICDSNRIKKIEKIQVLSSLADSQVWPPYHHTRVERFGGLWEESSPIRTFSILRPKTLYFHSNAVESSQPIDRLKTPSQFTIDQMKLHFIGADVNYLGFKRCELAFRPMIRVIIVFSSSIFLTFLGIITFHMIICCATDLFLSTPRLFLLFLSPPIFFLKS